MSTVPAATSKVSEAPPKNAVTHTVSTKQRQADVDRKVSRGRSDTLFGLDSLHEEVEFTCLVQIKFFGVIQAFREGRYPDNKQIDETLRYVERNSPINLDELSDDGRKLVTDFRGIIATARQIVNEKNANEEVQNFLYATRKASVADNANVNSSLTKDGAKKDAETAGEAFRTIFELFLRNGEIRKLVQDAAVIGRDIFADAAVKAGDLARPDEEKLASVDQPAPDNEFHDDIPDAFKSKTPEEKEAIRKQREADKAAAKARASQAAQSVDPNDPTSSQNQEAVKQKAQEQKEALLGKIPDQHREKITEHKDKTVDYFKEKFPEERRDHYIYRLKKVLVECQRHRDWQDSIGYLLTTFENYKGHANDLHSQVENSASNVRGEGNIQTAETAFRTVLERFANGRPTQPILDAIDQIYTDVKNDPELKDWFKRLDSYLRRLLLEPGFVMKDDADREARQLRESGKKFFNVSTVDKSSSGQSNTNGSHPTGYSTGGTSQGVSGVPAGVVRADGVAGGLQAAAPLQNINQTQSVGGHPSPLQNLASQGVANGLNQAQSTGVTADGKYKPHLDRIWDELQIFTKGMAEDPLNQKFGDSWHGLFRDLVYDEHGSPTFKGHLIQDIIQTILPSLLTHISYVPLPRIEYTDPEVDLVVENIAVAPINLLPNVLEFDAHNYVKASAFKGIDSRHRHSFKLTLSQIHLEMRDVYFQINKKSGMKLKEHGVADIFLGGKGLTVTANIEGGNEARGRRSRNVFIVKETKAHIDNLDFALRQSKHNIAAKVFKPLVKPIVKKQIAKAVEQAIRDALEKLNEQLTSARNAVYDAEQGQKGDALKQKFQKDEKETQGTGEKKGTFKIPTSKRDSVLPQMGTKDGWIRKLDERTEAAKVTSGRSPWSSTAFDITSTR